MDVTRAVHGHDFDVVNSSLGRGWIAANVFVVVVTGLLVWLVVAGVGGNAGTDATHIGIATVVLAGLYWIWLAACADHPAEDWWLNWPIAIAASVGVVFTAHGFALLLVDARHHPHQVGRDIVFTLAPLAILAAVVVVEVWRIRRDRIEADGLAERLGIYPYR